MFVLFSKCRRARDRSKNGPNTYDRRGITRRTRPGSRYITRFPGRLTTSMMCTSTPRSVLLPRNSRYPDRTVQQFISELIHTTELYISLFINRCTAPPVFTRVNRCFFALNHFGVNSAMSSDLSVLSNFRTCIVYPLSIHFENAYRSIWSFLSDFKLPFFISDFRAHRQGDRQRSGHRYLNTANIAVFS